MPSVGVVKGLDILEDGSSGSLSGLILVKVDLLSFEGMIK